MRSRLRPRWLGSSVSFGDHFALVPMRRRSTARTSQMVAIVSIALHVVLENTLRFGFGSDLLSYDLLIARDGRFVGIQVDSQQIRNLAIERIPEAPSPSPVNHFLFMATSREMSALPSANECPGFELIQSPTRGMRSTTPSSPMVGRVDVEPVAPHPGVR